MMRVCRVHLGTPDVLAQTESVKSAVLRLGNDPERAAPIVAAEHPAVPERAAKGSRMASP
jgi:hypothetical protein